ncbi:MAG TPA: UbiA family prenyltransferase [Vicinamibacterales bacterium]|nr:UbiA family prenyltransferase [Vicinamibacterales bacterium]
MSEVGSRRVGLVVRLVHYWWPVALGWSIALVWNQVSARPASHAGLAVLLWGIFGAYSLDRLLDGTPPADPAWLRAVLAVAFALSVAASLFYLVALPPGTIALIPLLAAAGLFYRRLKRYPLTKTVLVPVVWVWAGLALPAADGSWFGWRSVLLPVSAPLVALFAAGCLLCDVKDADADSRTGVKSLPAVFGIPSTIAVATALAVAGALMAWLQQRTGLLVTGLALVGMGQWTTVLTAGPAGALLVDLALTIPGFLIFTHLVR